MKKICFVTAARSEYGLLKWVMKEVDASTDFELQLVVTGGHLLKEQGHTVDRIIEDGFRIDMEVDSHLDFSSQEDIAASMGRMAEGMSHAFSYLHPDYLVVLGDRYELLPICNTAFVMNIPIIHISGGDVTEGAIDNGIRNAVTMLATYHFPGTIESADNIIRMRGSNTNVWSVGEPGLDAFNKELLMNRAEIAEALGLEIDKQWILMTYHAETQDSLTNDLETVASCCNALKSIPNSTVVMTYANADFGGDRINEYLEKVSHNNSLLFKCRPSLGSRLYLSLMKQVVLVIGNSSSGIVEAPTLKIPVVNIGNRQKGRHLCSNVIQSGKSYEEIINAIEIALNTVVDDSDVDYWGDGKTAERIVHQLRNVV